MSLESHNVDIAALTELIATLRAGGVSRYQTPELTLELLPAAPVAQTHITEQPAQTPVAADEDDIAFWSAE